MKAVNIVTHYDVLLSFSAADNDIAELLKEELIGLGLSVYYYGDENNTGKSLSSHTIEVYQKASSYVAICIISKHYNNGWADTELKILIDRHKKEKNFTLYLLSIDGTTNELVGNDLIYHKWVASTKEEKQIQAIKTAEHVKGKIEDHKRSKRHKRIWVVIALTLTLSLPVTAYFYHENMALSQRVYLENECTDTSLKPDPALQLTIAGTDSALSVVTEKGQYVIKGLQQKDIGRKVAVHLQSNEWELADSVLTVKDRYTALPVRHRHGCTQRYTIRLRDSDNAVPADIGRATLVISDAVTARDSVFAISPGGETAVQYRRMQGLSVSLTSDAYRLSSPDVSLDPGVNTLYVTPVFRERRPEPGNVVAKILLNGDTYATSGTLVNGRPVSPLPGSGFTQRYIRLSKAKDDYEIALVQDDTCRVVANLRSYADNDTLPLIAHCL